MLPVSMWNSIPKPAQATVAATHPHAHAHHALAAAAAAAEQQQLQYFYTTLGHQVPVQPQLLHSHANLLSATSVVPGITHSNPIAHTIPQQQVYAPAAVTPQPPQLPPSVSPPQQPLTLSIPPASASDPLADILASSAGQGKKRGSDELLSHSPMVTNGTGMSPTQTEVNNDAKKVKLEGNVVCKPSRVLHFRGVPQDATEGEIVQLGLPFGRMTNLVLAKKKNQALLEMADVTSAQTMVTYYTERPPQIRGRTVYVQFSNHEQLKTETSAQNQGAQAALQAAQQLMGSVEDPKTVLRVIVEHMLYPVTIDVLKQIFSRYGQVLKIVTFSKNNTFQALIQYSDPIAAQTAKVSLNGQNIYNGCCTLRIDFSKLQALNVKYNNDKSRDYTNPNLPSGEGGPSLQVDPGAALGLGGSQGVLSSPFGAVPGFGASALGGGGGGMGHHHHHNLYGAAAGGAGGNSHHAAAAALAAHQGHGGAGALKYKLMNAQAQAGLGGMGAFQAVPFGLAGLNPAAAASIGAAGLRLPGQPQTGAVLLVSNLNEQKVTPDALFTLFGVYGDVIRVKIMFNKKDNALIQFADAAQASCCLTHMDKLKVWGKNIKVAPSKHSMVQMPKEGQPDAGLTKDYTNSPLHRFKKPNSKNHHNIFPPSATLHLSNIPPTTTEEQLQELFTEHGTVVAFKFFQKDRKMALIQMSSVEEAVHALMALHNHQLAETSHLRVSYSKSTIAPGATSPLHLQQQQQQQQVQALSLPQPGGVVVAAPQELVLVSTVGGGQQPDLSQSPSDEASLSP